MSNKLYDLLKDILMLGLPGVAALYSALAGFWNFPASEAVVGTIGAIGVFLGVILKIAKHYYDIKEEECDG